jgi:aarF domain-containing kinase
MLTNSFKYLDKEPIAAASLAQVYRGILHDGTEVALKIQYPRLRETAFGDIKTFNVLMSVAEWAFPQVRLKWLVKEFQDNLPNELDFRLEGKNNERLMESLEKKFTNVRTPKVYWDMTSERVLTVRIFKLH